MELFHLAMADDWAAAQVDGQYTISTRGRTLAEEGYIHCSFAEQVGPTATRYYGDAPDVVLLRIDADRLSSPVVVEDLTGSGEPFPHIYGPIDITAVVDARPWAPTDDSPETSSR